MEHFIRLLIESLFIVLSDTPALRVMRPH